MGKSTSVKNGNRKTRERAPHKLNGKRIVQGMQKQGNQSHIHIIVSRKDASNLYSLSPGSKCKASEVTLNGKSVKRGFDRDAFFNKAEQTFDNTFDYKRNFVESYKARKDFIKDPKLYFTSLLEIPTNQKAVAFKLLSKIGVPLTSIPVSKVQLVIKGIKHKDSFILQDIDEIISSTGSRPDFSFLREIRFDSDASIESVPRLANLIDPNIHSCGTVRPHGEAELRQKEKNFYIVGMKSYGRAPTFLMTTGYEQVRSKVAFMNGDFESAKRVELNLPETGVCSSGIGIVIKEAKVKIKSSCATSCSI